MKTKIYALIFILLIGFVAYTVYSKSAKEREAKKDKNFKIEDFDKVSEIKITDRLGKKMSLKHQKNGWIVNDKYPVRQHLFKDLKEALTTMEAFNPVPTIATQNVIFEMMQHAIKVEIYKGGNKPSKVIYIGGPNVTNTASNMFLEYDGVPSNRIYEVGIPGFRGYLTTRFLVNESEWRSKKIFNYEPSQFKSIDIKYFNKYGKEDFTLSKNNDKYTLQYKGKEYTDDMLDQKNIITYILRLKNKQVMAYSFQNPEDQAVKDSLLNVKKYAEIRIVDNKNKENFMTIVDMPLNRGSSSQYDENGDLMTYDIDYKYIIFGENKEWGIVSKDNFGRLFIEPNRFLKK